MSTKSLQEEIQKRVQKKIFPLLERYLFDQGELDSILKWKPVVLFIGNYSSGKSTLVNEILGMEIQWMG